MKARLILSNMRWYTYQLLIKLGWVGFVAILLMLASGWMSYRNQQMLPSIQVQESEIETLKVKIAAVPRIQSNSILPSTSTDFFAQFTPDDMLARQLNGLASQAKAVGIRLPQGNYRLIESKVGRLSRYEITFPIVTSYPKLRQFIAVATETNPGLALQDLSISRESTQNGSVEVDLVFYLYLKSKVA